MDSRPEYIGSAHTLSRALRICYHLTDIAEKRAVCTASATRQRLTRLRRKRKARRTTGENGHYSRRSRSSATHSATHIRQAATNYKGRSLLDIWPAPAVVDSIGLLITSRRTVPFLFQLLRPVPGAEHLRGLEGCFNLLRLNLLRSTSTYVRAVQTQAWCVEATPVSTASTSE